MEARAMNHQTYRLHRLYLGHTNQAFKFAHAEHTQFMRVTYQVPEHRCHSTDSLCVDYLDPRDGLNNATEFKANEEIFMSIDCARAIWNMLHANGWE